MPIVIEQGYNDHLMSSREMNSFALNIQVAKTEAERLKVLKDYGLTEKDFPDGRVPGLPPDESPAV
ncbi:hypothetical protein [Streptomyces montanisoli]|uniref:Uncharacterized protein n=1 Tax=Streptomyces montanisoli TaxID=2798581 RepID=A0A940M9C8_9ACTN|nr:hypothetical protein [Streptomyces montanisoli]MBP0455915.1 hypothetical protein [Streptomyces montanisoli]